MAALQNALLGIWKIASCTKRIKKKKKSWPFDLRCASSRVILPRCPFPSCVSVPPLLPPLCSATSAGDSIEQTDRKWSRGVGDNRSGIVKQFSGQEGISSACVQLIRSHSSTHRSDTRGQGPRPLQLHGETHTHPSACSVASEYTTTLFSLCCSVQLE